MRGFRAVVYKSVAGMEDWLGLGSTTDNCRNFGYEGCGAHYSILGL